MMKLLIPGSDTSERLIKHLPDPECLRLLEAAAPGSMKQVLRLAEKESEQNRKEAKQLLEEEIKDRAHRRRMDWIDRFLKTLPYIIAFVTAPAVAKAVLSSEPLAKLITVIRAGLS